MVVPVVVDVDVEETTEESSATSGEALTRPAMSIMTETESVAIFMTRTWRTEQRPEDSSEDAEDGDALVRAGVVSDSDSKFQPLYTSPGFSISSLRGTPVSARVGLITS